MAITLDGCGQIDREEMSGILPRVREFEAGGPEQFLNSPARELVAVFGVNGLAFGEVKRQRVASAVRRDVNGLPMAGDEMHLDT